MSKLHITPDVTYETLEVYLPGTQRTLEVDLTVSWEKRESRTDDNYPMDEAEILVTEVEYKAGPNDRRFWVDPDDLDENTPGVIKQEIYKALVNNSWSPPKFIE